MSAGPRAFPRSASIAPLSQEEQLGPRAGCPVPRFPPCSAAPNPAGSLCLTPCQVPGQAPQIFGSLPGVSRPRQRVPSVVSARAPRCVGARALPGCGPEPCCAYVCALVTCSVLDPRCATGRRKERGKEGEENHSESVPRWPLSWGYSLVGSRAGARLCVLGEHGGVETFYSGQDICENNSYS